MRTNIRLYEALVDEMGCCKSPDPVKFETHDEGTIIRCKNCRERHRYFISTNKHLLAKYLYCSECWGSGKVDDFIMGVEDCKWCDGSGWVFNEKSNKLKHKVRTEFGCNNCDGEGEILDMYAGPDVDDPRYECTECGGSGFTLSSVIRGIKDYIKSPFTCEECGGEGNIRFTMRVYDEDKNIKDQVSKDTECWECNGTGYANKLKKLIK